MEFRFCPACATPLLPLTEGHDAGLPACPDGHYVHYENPAVTTFAFLKNDEGRYLALRRAHAPASGEWDLPGGFIDAGEYPEQTICREISEEIGLEASDLEVFGAWTGQYGPDGKWTVDIAFHGRCGPGEIVLSPEKSEYAWVELEAFPTPAFNSERLALARLLEDRPKA